MILLLTTADTEVLAADAAVALLPDGFGTVRARNPTAPGAPGPDELLAPVLDRPGGPAGATPGAAAGAAQNAAAGAAPRVVLVRLLGGRRAWAAFDRLAAGCAAAGVPLLAFSGESSPDAELTAASTAPAGVVADAFEYLRHGGVANLANLFRFVSDTLLRTGFGFEPPAPLPLEGWWHPRHEDPLAAADPARPSVGVVFYRTHWMSGNTGFVETLVDELEAAGANALPVFCYSLRPAGDRGRVGALDMLAGQVDAVITTVLAMGGTPGELAGRRSTAGPDGAAAGGGADGTGVEEAWAVPALAALGVPVIQGMAATSSRAAWLAAANGLSPLDTAMQVAMPEFDGRLIGVPFSFKETVADGPAGGGDGAGDGAVRYVADPERTRRLAGLAVRQARLRRTPNQAKRVAVVLSNYPTKHSRVGNAVGLDTPASAVRLLDQLTEAGYDTGGWAGAGLDGDGLIHRLIAAGGFDEEFLTGDQLTAAAARVPAAGYAKWFEALPAPLRERIVEHWGEPPGTLYVDDRDAGHRRDGRAGGGTGGAGDTGGAPGAAAGGDLVFAALPFGNVLVAIQPPRGFGENPVAIYHDPDLPPSHHYLAFYRWLDEVWGADAVVHLGKHGTLEWLPGKGLGLSAGCAPDAVLGELPLVYPFVVNDPGEGTQAKRRAHALLVDHLVPPMTRAETYGDLARLEQLLDEYYQVQTLDPAKAPALRGEIWHLLRTAELTRDLSLPHRDQLPPSEFDELLPHVDGYLCELKDLSIRGGLHVLGQAPTGEARTGLVLAILRLAQAGLPGLRAAIGARFGLDETALLDDPGLPAAVPAALAGRFPGPALTGSDALDRLEDAARALVEGMDAESWDPAAAEAVVRGVLGADALEAGGAGATEAKGTTAAKGTTGVEGATEAKGTTAAKGTTGVEGATDAEGTTAVERAADATVVAESTGAVAAAAAVVRVLRFAATEVVPRLAGTERELPSVLDGLAGRYVPSGPSGSPTRGRVDVLPTGKNFYSVDPKALPSELAWHVGQRLAADLVARYERETGQPPVSVGIVVWGTAAMRTHGDDIAEILALLGVRPVWQPESRRVTGLELIPLDELGRARVDVTVRISGFFRDAFPHLVQLLDDAVGMVADLDEPEDRNPVAARVRADTERLTAGGVAPDAARRRASARVFGSKPGAYGAGLLPLIDARNWQTDADLAEVYAVWGGYAYGRGLDGAPARDDMERVFSRLQVAVKNIDTREHDLLDADDYFQYHGGMVAMVRSLTGSSPRAYIGDSADPGRTRTRDLAEETARVFRARAVNPKWIDAMRRHGYKGAFELAATVDYLFGYDATAGVVHDWMYQALTERYVMDPEVRAFLERSNPWALRAIAERLLEAADRKLWAEPDPESLDHLREVYLELEGDLEERSAAAGTGEPAAAASGASPGGSPAADSPSASPAGSPGGHRADRPSGGPVDSHRTPSPDPAIGTQQGGQP